MNFNVLISQIETTHHNLQAYAVNAINVSLTVRNYLFGFYIIARKYCRTFETYQRFVVQKFKYVSPVLCILSANFTTIDC